MSATNGFAPAARLATYVSGSNTPLDPTRTVLYYDVAIIVMKMAVLTARNWNESSTNYFLVSKEYTAQLRLVLYDRVIIKTASALNLLHRTVTTTPAIAQLIKDCQVLLFPTNHHSVPYLKTAYRAVPQQVARILTEIAPSVTSLVLTLPIHPEILYAFRSSAYPMLHTLRTFHNFLLAPNITIWYQAQLRSWYHWLENGTRTGRRPRLTNANIPSYPFPLLKHIDIHFDDGTPHFDCPAYDYRHLRAAKEVTFRLANDESWEYNLYEYLQFINPPRHADVLALKWWPTSPPVPDDQNAYLFHPKTVIPIVGNPAVHQLPVGDGMDFFNRITLMVPASTLSPIFWREAKKYLRSRYLDPSVLSRNSHNLVTVVRTS
ncbi:hypothetical protein VNI00_017435 [Paramarasmius palmivorus]|uniref:Glycosyltransferase n=1 Tax=Paramarasmius palmivorus TaxID=297713 RepID=A0AAW0B637_9AGAR